MSTQWRIGMNGPTGLDYGCLPQIMDWLGMDEKKRATAFKDIRLMERIALSVLHGNSR
jgi:hypothetical protein